MATIYRCDWCDQEIEAPGRDKAPAVINKIAENAAGTQLLIRIGTSVKGIAPGDTVSDLHWRCLADALRSITGEIEGDDPEIPASREVPF